LRFWHPNSNLQLQASLQASSLCFLLCQPLGKSLLLLQDKWPLKTRGHLRRNQPRRWLKTSRRAGPCRNPRSWVRHLRKNREGKAKQKKKNPLKADKRAVMGKQKEPKDGPSSGEEAIDLDSEET